MKGKGKQKKSQAPTVGACVYARPTPYSRACRAALCWESSCRNASCLATAAHHARESLGMELRTECVL